MACKHFLNTYVLSVSPLRIILAIVATLLVPTQLMGKGQFSAKTTVPSTQQDASSLSFLQAVAYDTGGYDPSSVVVADVNGDGVPDIIVANIRRNLTDQLFGASNVGVMLGNGDGTFQPVVTYLSGGSDLHSLAIADVNNDGKLDILAGNGCSIISQGTCSVEGAVGVLLGNGDGTFRPAVNYDSGGFAYYQMKVTVADVNGEGKPDLVTSNGCASACDPIGPPQGTVGVLLGNGDGTFQKPVVYATGGYFANSIATGDLNGDRKLDIVVTNYCGDGNIGGCTISGPVGVLLGNGDGTFQAVMPFPSGGQGTSSVVVADVNADGKPDLLVSNCGSDGCGAFWPPRPGGVVGVLLGRGDGTFSATVTYGSGSYPTLDLGDVDGDGKPDLVLADWSCSSSGSCISVMPGNGDGTFQNAVNFAMEINADSLAVADLNSDDKPDIVTATAEAFGSNDPPGTVNVLLNNTASSGIATSTALVSSLNPSLVGQAVSFTATVSSSAGAPPNGETITFKNGPALLGTAPLSAGKAMITTSSLPAGIFTITASYPGDSNFTASTSPGLRQVVNSTTKSPTTTTFVSSLNPSIYGQNITFTATVTTTGPVPPTGTVVFRWSDGFRTFNIGSAKLNNNGIAILKKSNLNAAAYPLTATYQGDTNNLTSTSPILNQTVVQATSAATITSSPNPSSVGQAVTFTAQITSPTVTPTGPVTFKAGTTALGTVQLSGGKANYTTTSLPAGSTVVKVTYNGDSNIKGSSAAVTQVVQP